MFIKCTLFLSNLRSPIIPICFLSLGLGLRKSAKYWAFRLISVLYFPSGIGNMFCSNKITLAFRWRPCVNNRDTTGLSVASAIKSFRMMLLYRGLISHRFSDSSGTPLSNRMLLPRLAKMHAKSPIQMSQFFCRPCVNYPNTGD